MRKWIGVLLCILTTALAVAAEGGGELALKDKKKFKLNRRADYKAGLNAYVLGPVGTAALSFDFFITPKVSLEVGGGFRTFEGDYGFLAGGRYHFFGNTPLNITPYIGVFSGFQEKDSDVQNYNLYIPFGLQRIKKNHFTWSFEVAYQRNAYRLDDNFFGGFKLGYRF